MRKYLCEMRDVLLGVVLRKIHCNPSLSLLCYQLLLPLGFGIDFGIKNDRGGRWGPQVADYGIAHN
jgi:hypothetical protein